MLGAARASQYAGWWGGPPKFVSTSQTTVACSGKYLDAVSITPNGWGMPGNTRSFDNTGVVSGAKGTQVITFKYQAQSNFTWTTDTFRTNYQYIDTGSGANLLTIWNYFYQNTVETWDSMLARTVTGNYLSIKASFGSYEYFTLTGNLPWDDYANRWLTAIISYSDSQTDFSDWTGTTGGTNWYQRIVLQDAVTGQLISTTDSRYSAFNNPITTWANYTWSWDNVNSGSGTTANTAFASLVGPSGVTYDQTDMLVAAWWGCQGTMVDPLATVDSVQLRQYFVGQCFPETVNGSRAWFNFTPFAIVVDNNDSLLPLALAARSSQSNNYAYKQITSSLTTPATDTSIP